MKTSMTTLILEQCARIIEQRIIPDLTGNIARAQAMSMVVVLRRLAPFVEEKSQELHQENEEIGKVLEKVLSELQREETLTANRDRNRLIEILNHELKEKIYGPPDVNKKNYNLKQTLVETIKGLDALDNKLPAETMSSLRRQIRSVLRQQLDFSLARSGRQGGSG